MLKTYKIRCCFAILTALIFIFYGIATAEASPVVENHYGDTGCQDINRTLIFMSPPMQGADVLELQERLLELGYSVSATGTYDQNTAAQVSKFKKEHGLEPTSEVGPLTWAALGNSSTSSAASSKRKVPEKPTGQVSIRIDVIKQKLTVYNNNQEYFTFPIAVGKHETPSPHGEFKIVSKGAWGGGFGTRWNGLNVPWGTFGIHGTNKPWSIGRYASHGCIRMNNRDVETLFPWVPIGTPVKLVNENLKPTQRISSTIKPKSSGQNVVFAQEALKEQRFLIGLADGIYGRTTELAVSLFQAYNNLPITGTIDPETYQVLMGSKE